MPVPLAILAPAIAITAIGGGLLYFFYPTKSFSVNELNSRYSSSSTPAKNAKIKQVADNLGIPSQWLGDLIAFESGGTFNPKIQYGSFLPSSEREVRDTAIGLIQFTKPTRNYYGVTATDLYRMSFNQQMDLVQKYYENILAGKHWHKFPPIRKYDTKIKVFMAVYDPRYMNTPDRLFNAAIVKANPGASTPRAYAESAERFVQRLR